MQNTFNMLSSLRDQRLAHVSNEKLALLYQKLPNSSIIAEIFCKNIDLFNRINHKFKKISEDEKVSTILQWIDKSLATYKDTQQTKFSSYLYTNIKRRLMSLLSYYKYKDRDQIFSTISLDAPINSSTIDPEQSDCTYEDIIEDPNTDYARIDFKVAIEQNKKLTQLEKNYCMEFLHSDFPDAQIVQEKYGLDPQQSFYLRQSIKTKLSNEMEI